MKNLKKLLKIVIIGMALLSVNACRETMRGVGEDTEKVGEEIKDATN